MAIGPEEITFELSGGVANSDPLLSFGGAKSGNMIEEFQSTITTNQGTDHSILIDSSRIGDGDGVHVNKWILVLDGGNKMRAGRVTDFVSATGTFIIEQPLPNASSSGDFYRLFDINSLFHEVTEQQCAEGHTDYRLVYAVNTSGVSGDLWQVSLRIHGEGVSWGGVEFELFSKDDADPVEATPADEETAPAGLTVVKRFTPTLVPFGIPSGQPSREHFTAASWPAAGFRAVYVKRIIPQNQRRQVTDVGMVVLTIIDDTMATIESGFLFPFGLLGFTPDISIDPDRGPIRTQQQIDDGFDSAVRVGHGARYGAEVRAVETGLLVPDLEVGWSLSGPGQLFTDVAPITDSQGVSRVTYSAPSAATVTRQVITEAGQAGQGTAGTKNTNSGAFNLTVDPGTDRVLLVLVHAGTKNEDPSDLTPYGKTSLVTYGGEPLTEIVNAFSPTGVRIDYWLMLSPPVGTAEVAMQLPGQAIGIRFNGIAFSGVDQISPLDVPAQILVEENSGLTTFTHAITTVTDGAMLVGNLADAHPPDFFIGSLGGQTSYVSDAGGQVPDQSAQIEAEFKLAAVAGAQTIGWDSIDTGSDRVGCVVALRPALTPATLTAKV